MNVEVTNIINVKTTCDECGQEVAHQHPFLPYRISFDILTPAEAISFHDNIGFQITEDMIDTERLMFILFNRCSATHAVKRTDYFSMKID